MDAHELAGWVEGAVSDMAHSQYTMWKESKFGDERLDALVKRGVMDLQGALADELYNDAELLTDLLGDQIHDATIHDPSKRKEYIAELRTARSYSAWNTALDELEKR